MTARIPTRRSARPRPHPRAGFSLAELVVTMAVFSVLMIGVGAALSMALRAVDDGRNPSARTAAVAAGVAQMAADISRATAFTQRDAKAIEFTVPDCTGDGAADTIRYEWAGKPDDPILRRLNTGSLLPIADAAGDFALTYTTRSVTSRSTVASTSSVNTTLASFSSWPGIMGLSTDFRASGSDWAAGYIKLDPSIMPSGSNKIQVSRVSLIMKSALGLGGSVTVGIYKASAAGNPIPAATPIGTPVSKDLSLLSGSYAWVHFDFSDVQLGAADQEIVILIKGGGLLGLGNTYVQYLNSSSAPADSTMLVWTNNSGGSWNPSTSTRNRNDLKFVLYGSTTTTTTSEVLAATHFLDAVGIDIAPASTGGQRVRTTARILNTPEIPAP